MTEARIAAVILAAGQSRRMGPLNKLLLTVDGQPCVVHAVRAALAAGADPVRVVVVAADNPVARALAGWPVEIVVSPHADEGMAHSLAAGVTNLDEDVTGALIMLGDMPLVSAESLRQLCGALRTDPSLAACVPSHLGKRGNPVLWHRRHFPALQALTGDRGARSLMRRLEVGVAEVAVPDDGVLIDIDTAEAAADLQHRLRLAAGDVSPAPDLATLAKASPSQAPVPGQGVELSLDGRFCPDQATVWLATEEDRIACCDATAHGCLLSRAAAGALRRDAPGADLGAILDAATYLRGLAAGEGGAPPPGFPSLAAFAALQQFPRRLGCVLLPFETASRLLASRTSDQPAAPDGR